MSAHYKKIAAQLRWQSLAIITALFLSMICMPEIGQAQNCYWAVAGTTTPTTAGSWDFSVTFPATISVPRDAPVGATIATATQIAPAINKVINCSTAGRIMQTANRIVDTFSKGKMESGVAGIVMQQYFSSNPSDPNSFNYYPWVYSNAKPAGNGYTLNGQARRIVLVKDAAVVAAGTIPAGVLITMTQNPGNLSFGSISLANKITIVPQTCQVTTTAIVVPLTPVTGIKAATFVNVGDKSSSIPFNVGVDCSGVASNVYMTLTDQQNPDNTTSTLPLTTASTATGLGIQILLRGNPIKFGPDSSTAGNTNQFGVFSSDGETTGTTNIPLTARYIRTGTVKPGTANGVATFTMSYQ